MGRALADDAKLYVGIEEGIVFMYRMYSLLTSLDGIGMRIVCASDDRTVRVWCTESGAAVFEPLKTKHVCGLLALGSITRTSRVRVMLPTAQPATPLVV